jgi:hypothetical protein
LAKRSYVIADAMLAARKPPKAVPAEPDIAEVIAAWLKPGRTDAEKHNLLSYIRWDLGVDLKKPETDAQ